MIILNLEGMTEGGKEGGGAKGTKGGFCFGSAKVEKWFVLLSAFWLDFELRAVLSLGLFGRIGVDARAGRAKVDT